MSKHEEKSCPRCRSLFTCKEGDVANCQCNEVVLSHETTSFLAQTYFDCLCKNCLLKIGKDVKQASGHQFPSQKELLLEGLHYYRENGLLVFTELYHTLRGYCCGNGCRHCTYGFTQPGEKA